jgi:hypothetical protein
MLEAEVSMRRIFLRLVFWMCLLPVVGAWAHEGHDHADAAPLAISLTFDKQGTLWRAGVKEGYVVVDASKDMGKTFSSPVKVNPLPQKIGADGEARPKIAISPEGNVYVTWTEALKKAFSGYIWFARSVDGGKSFEKPYTAHQDKAEITHRFDALHVAQNGEITVLWVDKRDLEAAKAAGKPYDGAAIYYAVSSDQGKTFQPERKLADSSCECCRIATTTKPDGTVVALWRHVFQGSERDHMMAEVKPNAEPHRATFGHWVVDGCPHHGAALAIGGEGENWWGYHMAYFDGNEKKPGLFYSRMDGVAWASSPAKLFGNTANQAGHPSLLSLSNKVYLVWREQKDGTNSIMGMMSDDEGKSWGKPQPLTSATQKSDYPFLLQYQNMPYLAWNVANEGLKLLPLQDKLTP